MPEIVIKYKGAKALRALNDFAKYFDFEVEKPKSKNAEGIHEKENSLLIVFSKNPDVSTLAGIWKGRNISLSELREKAWGGRL